MELCNKNKTLKMYLGCQLILFRDRTRKKRLDFIPAVRYDVFKRGKLFPD